MACTGHHAISPCGMPKCHGHNEQYFIQSREIRPLHVARPLKRYHHERFLPCSYRAVVGKHPDGTFQIIIQRASAMQKQRNTTHYISPSWMPAVPGSFPPMARKNSKRVQTSVNVPTKRSPASTLDPMGTAMYVYNALLAGMLRTVSLCGEIARLRNFHPLPASGAVLRSLESWCSS